MFEIGSKNTLDVGGRPLMLNASAYYFKYTDQVFSTVVGTELLDNDPSNDAGCLDSDPNTVCSNVTLNQNVGESHNMGVQLDAAYQLGNGFNIGGTLLWQDTEYEDGSVVSDGRRPSPAGGALLVDLGGNELPRTPPLTLNLRLGQDYEIATGTLDWIASATYKSSYFLTGFNGGSGEDGGREVTSVDASGVANGYGASLLRLRDEVDSYVHLDLGVGYTHGDGKLRVEAFGNNVTDEAHGDAGHDRHRHAGVRLQSAADLRPADAGELLMRRSPAGKAAAVCCGRRAVERGVRGSGQRRRGEGRGAARAHDARAEGRADGAGRTSAASRPTTCASTGSARC